jgi:hypothetical protein
VNIRDTLSFVADVLGTMIRSVRPARTAVSTLARIDDTVTLKRCSALEYFVLLFCHHLRSGRATGLPHTVLGFLRDIQLPGFPGRAPIDQARSARSRTS